MVVTLIVDPADHYKPQGYTNDELIEWCGLIPSFADDDSELPIKEQLDMNYGWPVSWNSKAHMDNHFYHYPQDEPLAAIAIIVYPKHKFSLNIMPYGIIGLHDMTANTWEFARMD